MIIRTNAKINLTLDIVGKRTDGYHLLRSVMLPIPFYDSMAMTPIKSGIKITCNLPYIPTDERNLVHKAASLFFEETGVDGGLNVTLEKHIPVGAGLGGGSANAAGILMSLNKLYNKGLTAAELCAMGARLGADVPFFIANKPQLAEGIGEILSPVPPLPPCKILLVMPNFSINTKWAFENLDYDSHTSRTDGLIDGLRSGDLLKIAPFVGNDMEDPIAKKYPLINKIKRQMLDSGAVAAAMSGSGSTVFGIYPANTTENDIRGSFSKLKFKLLSINL